MRHKLAPLLNRRIQFIAFIDRIEDSEQGKKKWLLKDLCLAKGELLLTDHVWIIHGLPAYMEQFTAGDWIIFHARVHTYWKLPPNGFWVKEYGICDPTNIKKITKRLQL